MSVFQSRTMDDAKRIVSQLAMGAHLAEWEGSASPFWQYATLTVGEHSFRVGVSTGGGDLFQWRSFHSHQATDVCDLQGRTQLLG